MIEGKVWGFWIILVKRCLFWWICKINEIGSIPKVFTFVRTNAYNL